MAGGSVKWTSHKTEAMITITSLSDTLLMIIASYLDPPEVYNLARSSKRFQMSSTELSFPTKKMGAENSSVASRLIQESLLHGVADVLQAGINSMSKARKIVEFQKRELDLGRRVLLSGSAAVQIATGRRFQNFDLNFYCNRESVPGFRQLMRDCGFCCMGIRPDYNHTNPPSTIDRVEIFVPSRGIETVPMKTIASEYYRAWNALTAAAEGDDEVPPELEDPPFGFVNDRNRLLRNFQRSGQRFPRDYPIALSPQHNFTTKEHDENDDQNRGSVQLAVCMTCPTQAIHQFDLEICATNFDGRHVRVPSISRTFNSQTNAGCYMKFINCYVPNFLSDISLYLESSYFTRLSLPQSMESEFARAPSSPLCDVGDTEVTDEMLIYIMECYVKTVGDVDIDTELAVLGTNDFRMLYSSNGELDVYSSPHIVLCLHNNLMRLLRRALKYIQRGIHVPLSDDVKVRLDSAIGEADDEKQRAKRKAEDDKFDRDWDKAATAATVVKFVRHKSLVGSEEEEKKKKRKEQLHAYNSTDTPSIPLRKDRAEQRRREESRG